MKQGIPLTSEHEILYQSDKFLERFSSNFHQDMTTVFSLDRERSERNVKLLNIVQHGYM